MAQIERADTPEAREIWATVDQVAENAPEWLRADVKAKMSGQEEPIECEPDFDKPQTIAMMAERHRVMTGNLKALEEARERIAELERQLEVERQRGDCLNVQLNGSNHRCRLVIDAKERWIDKWKAAKQDCDTLLETVATQAAEIERLKQLTGRRDRSEEGEGE